MTSEVLRADPLRVRGRRGAGLRIVEVIVIETREPGPRLGLGGGAASTQPEQQALEDALVAAQLAAGEQQRLDGLHRVDPGGIEIERALEVKQRLGIVAAQRGVDLPLVVMRGGVVGIDLERGVEVRPCAIRRLGSTLARVPLRPAERGVIVGLAGRARDHRADHVDCLRPLPLADQLLGHPEVELGIDRGWNLNELATRELAVVRGAPAIVEQDTPRHGVELAELADLRAIARVGEDAFLVLEHVGADARGGVDLLRGRAAIDHQHGVVIGALRTLMLDDHLLAGVGQRVALGVDLGQVHHARVFLLGHLDRRRAVELEADVVEQHVEQRRARRQLDGADRARLRHHDRLGGRQLEVAQRRPREAHVADVGLDGVAQDHRIERDPGRDAIEHRALERLDRRAIAEQGDQLLAEHALELVPEPHTAPGQLEAHPVEARQPVEVVDGGLAQPDEHDLDHPQLHTLDRVAVVEPPRALRPAQRLHDLVARLAPELIDQLLDGERAQGDQRLAELAADLRGACDRALVLLLGDHAAVDEEVPQRLVARRRRAAHRVAVDQIDRLR